jgi:hypothetical protein
LSNGQSLAAFGASAAQYVTPGGGGHAGPETVGAGALNLTRLIGAFHEKNLLQAKSELLPLLLYPAAVKNEVAASPRSSGSPGFFPL